MNLITRTPEIDSEIFVMRESECCSFASLHLPWSAASLALVNMSSMIMQQPARHAGPMTLNCKLIPTTVVAGPNQM